MTNLLKAAVSCLAIIAYVMGCRIWSRLGPAPTTFPYATAASWLILAFMVSWLWHRRLTSALLTMTGAVLTGAIWCVTLVDSPPGFVARLIYSSPHADVMGALIVFSPVLAATVGGAIMHERYLLSGGLMMLLGVLAVIPAALWNAHTHVPELQALHAVVASSETSYIYYVADSLEIALVTGLGVGAAALGHLVRARVSAMVIRGI